METSRRRLFGLLAAAPFVGNLIHFRFSTEAKYTLTFCPDCANAKRYRLQWLERVTRGPVMVAPEISHLAASMMPGIITYASVAEEVVAFAAPPPAHCLKHAA